MKNLTGLILLAVLAGSNNEAFARSAQTILPGVSHVAALGFGYDSESQRVKQIKCADGPVTYDGFQNSTISIHHNLSASDALELLDIQAEGSVDIGTFKLD